MCPLTVTIVNLTNGATARVSDTLNVLANATDTNNLISRVDFMANGIVVASATTAPPTAYPCRSLPRYGYSQAQAVDVWGTIGTSAPVVVTVTGQGRAHRRLQGWCSG
jgi:hypothetical protein